MKKKLISIIICAALVIILPACAGTSSENEEVQTASGSVVESGEISGFCPTGWYSPAISDIMNDTSDKKTSVSEMEFVKGAVNAERSENDPYVRIRYTSGNEEIPVPDKTCYDAPSDVESFTCGNYTWSGFKASSIWHEFTYLRADEDRGVLEVWVWTQSEESGLTLDSEEIRTILERIALIKK